jgi:transketolase
MFEEIEQNISSQAQSLSEAEMGDFKNKLRTMPKLALQYSDWLRDLEKYRLTIEINAKNYTEKLRQIQEKLPNEDLSFWSVFNQEVCGKFQQQIQVNLGYFVPSSDLIEKAITSIRGIVEIEQAESDRALERAMKDKEEAEQQRGKNLQIWLAAIGSGLAVSGISAQTAAKPVETILKQFSPKQSLECPNAGLGTCLGYSFSYVLFHVGIGVIAALVVGLLTKRFFKRSRLSS